VVGDEVLRLSTIGRILRRSSRLLLVLAAFGAVVGAAAALVWPPSYESHTEVLLQGPREKTEVVTEAQIAMSLVVLDRTATGLGWGVAGADLSVTAEVTKGNVIGITATAPNPNRARELAQRVTEEYITFSTELTTKAANATKDVLRTRQATVEQHVTDLNQRITQLQGSFQLLDPQNPKGADARAELERLRNERPDAFAELDSIDKRIGDADVQASAGRAGLRVIEPAGTPSAARPPTTVQLVLGAAVLAVALGILAQLIVRLADQRLRRRSDIAAAVGAPILGTVPAPTGATAEATSGPGPNGSHRRRHEAARGARIGWLRRDTDPRPTGVHDQALEDLRYQRVLAQLKERAAGSVRLLVVVLEGDGLASRAVARLAIAAATEGSVLDVVTVSAARPTLPNCPDSSAALLVVTSGTATGGQLLAVSEACQDAGCPAAGVLLVVRSTDEDDQEPQPRIGLSHGSGVALVDGMRHVEPVR
jgi:capsular polysaccharide biosynthesis protein